ncbi:MAG: M15 family metallopeptidase [Anaerolineales bacterium]|nr:M15 family metallopeptidase [Anaerolineales bacterium]
MTIPAHPRRWFGLFCLLVVAFSVGGCSPTATPSTAIVTDADESATITPHPRPPVVATGLPPTTPPPEATAPPTATDLPTIAPSPLPTASLTPSPTPDRNIPCSSRIPDNGLLTVVTLTYGLSRDYEPAGLVGLSGYLPNDVTLGYPTELRRVAVTPLVKMITDMQAAGLQPRVLSGYRSFSAQAIARQKWLEKEPDRANILSAPPGFSEHQLGTVIDFGSPELAEIVGQEDIEFHTWFYKTSEGRWLLDNAHKYGFTLSYPFEAFEITGFFYEPWHYRYVGVEMATQLHEEGISLTEHQLATEPPPCIPDSP